MSGELLYCIKKAHLSGALYIFIRSENMTEKEKSELGLLYDVNYDGEIVSERQRVN